MKTIPVVWGRWAAWEGGNSRRLALCNEAQCNTL